MSVLSSSRLNDTPTPLIHRRWRHLFLLALFFLVATPWSDGLARTAQEAADRAAFEQLRRAAQGGDPLAMVNTGALYYHGIGVGRQYDKAFFWFLKAARAGESWGQFNAGTMYLDGLGTPKNHEKAAYWLEKVADLDPRAARYNPIIRGWARLKMALMYLDGRGVAGDVRQAVALFEKAAREGLALGQYWMGRLSEEGRGLDRDPVEALVWYDLAAAQGSRDAEQARESLVRNMAPAQREAARRRADQHHRAPLEGLMREIESSGDPGVPIAIPATRGDQAPEAIETVDATASFGADAVVEPPGIEAPLELERETPEGAVAADERQNAASPRSTLTVQTLPGNARVRILNIRPPYQPGMPLPPGRYHLEASHRNHPTVRQWTTLGDESKTVIIDLSGGAADTAPVAGGQNTYALTVLPVPEDALVRVMNIVPRYRPGMPLGPGSYRIQVTRAGYWPQERQVVVKDRDVTERIVLGRMADGGDGAAPPPRAAGEQAETPAQRSFLAALTVRPSPEDARVRVLNIAPRYRPGMRLKPGSYHIEVAKAGYHAERRWVTLGRRDLEVAFSLRRDSGEARPSLTVLPTLTGAKVRLLNVAAPYRPGMALSPGRYHVEVSRPGFKTERRWVSLTDRDLNISIGLEELNPDESGALFVNTFPGDARVRILNIEPTYRPGIRLEPGRYLVEVTSPRYQGRRRWVEVGTGVVNMPVKLERR